MVRATEGTGGHPFRQFILKIHSRCDLACDYCYVYTQPDQAWRRQPPRMSRATVDHAARRIAEHTTAHDLPSVGVVLHGGEPLLAGMDTIVHCAQAVRAAVGRTRSVRVAVQTNGVALDVERIARLRRHDIRVGVSLDGDRAGHDRHRRFRNGHGSHGQVDAALRELARPENAAIFAGLLCTIDLDNSPVHTYESLLRYGPPQIDFLLPEGNWTRPPPGRPADLRPSGYTEWLTAVFDRWYDHPVKETGIRYFDDVISVLLGGGAVGVGVSTAPVASLVIETDGSIGASDALTATTPDAAHTGLSVLTDPLDSALRVPLVRQMQSGEHALADSCRRCSIMDVCGGGVHSQRFRHGHGFRNPSVYCSDLYGVITHVRRRVTADLHDLRSARFTG